MNYPKLNFSFKSVDIESPIPELKVGDDFRYSGTYFEEYEEGVSKIVNFYKTLPLLDGVEYVSEIKHLNKYPVMMKLENSKVILLGFITPDGFEVSEDFNS
jgi:hypothetical protein